MIASRQSGALTVNVLISRKIIDMKSLTRAPIELTERDRARGRVLFNVEATSEYLISILVTGAYLAKITSYMGLTDSQTALVTSMVQLGNALQIVAIFFKQSISPKRLVTICHLINELAFTSLYILPLFDLPMGIRPTLVTLIALVGFVLTYLIFPPKYAWYMGFVDEHKYGSFTALKEIISLASGMLFSYIAGHVIDSYEARGNLKGAFIVCSITLLTLTLIHSLSLLLTKDKPNEGYAEVSVKSQIKELFLNKSFIKVLIAISLCSMAMYVTTPFLGTYQIKELGFEMGFISILSILYSVTRAAASVPLGKLADRYSFFTMLNLAYGIMALSFLINCFTVPENGKVLYAVYYCVYAVSLAGTNQGNTNVIFEYTPLSVRACAIAIKGAVFGAVGFLSTLLVTPLVEYVQANGLYLFGRSIYAQQLLSAISFAIMIVLLIYMNTVVRKASKPTAL